MKRLYLLSFLLILGISLSAQGTRDSLWMIWNDAAQADTSRLKAIQQLAWGLLYSNPDSTALLATKELEFAQKTNHKKWVGKAFNNLGSTYHVKGKLTEALFYYQKALSVFLELNDPKSTSALYNNIGLIYSQRGNYTKALEYHLKDLEIGESLKDNEILSSCYNNLGTVYSNLSNFSRALEYFRKALQLAQSVPDKMGIAIGYNNIGSCYYNQELYAEALEHYQKSVALRLEMEDRHGLSILYNNIGLVYRDQKAYPKAIEYFQKAIPIEEQLDDQSGLSVSYHNMGSTLNEQKEFSKAALWCAKSLKMGEQTASIRLSRNACNCLYEAYKGMKKSEQALHWHEQYVSLNDSLQKEETNKRLEQFEFDKEVLADSLLREEEKQEIKIAYQVDLNKKNQTRNLILIISIGILLLAMIFLSRMLYFQKRSESFQNKSQQLEKQQLINEIDLLRTQVNPHFLFNSLSILSSLVHVNADLSEQFIDQLSRSYRYILDQKDQMLVTLRTELEFIRSYAFLLEIRFEKKFELRIQIAESALDRFKIAPLTLQLLVENAVKHNRMSVSEPLIVEVSIEKEFLVVKNRLQLRPQRESSTGTGLNNIINRYALLTDRLVKAGECEDSFIVRVPLL